MSKMKINKSININKLKVGSEIKTFGDSTVYLKKGHKFSLHISNSPWEYTVKYIDSDYVLLELLGYPGISMYLLSNCEFIERI